ncbi:hypothetical protein K2173_022542 [Erythroxylum novogranatense]|uniref:Uncharacterized protein n=1 Tax=Erythroxylum novogranatense TaxID=1862640 RepID=A0AAV8TIA6_9ROSI|nr:hypothetical protein K2173_022542 [Erythroxylum novogranatense]
MSCAYLTIPITTFSSSLNPNSKVLFPPNLAHFHCKNWLNPKASISIAKPRGLRIRASTSNGGETNNWISRLPVGAFAADKLFKLISGAAASPIAQFISSPTTFLHSVDPRIKLVWLLALVVLPARSHIVMRFGLVIFTALLSIWILPRPVWMDQLGRVSLLSGILFVMLGLGADGAPPLVQLRTPPLLFICNSEVSPLQFTRKGLSVASTAACLTFIIFQSASLCLATTTPEQLAYVGVPVAEIILTLLLSLRFINLVFDEVRNVALGIVSRRINWQQLTVMETIDILLPTYVGSSQIFSAIQNKSLRQ